MKTLSRLTLGITAAVAFGITQAHAVIYFQDNFSYADGAITNVSGGVWVGHNGASPVNVTNGHAIASMNLTQDVNADLAGGPISGSAIYAKFDLWADALPTGTSSYFFHFKDNSTANFVGRMQLNLSGSNYRVGISINATASAVTFPLDISLGQTNTVVVKWDPTNPNLNSYTLWLNPASESDPSVNTTGTGLTNLPIYEVAIRQSTTLGVANLDNMVVGDSFSAVTIPEPSTVILVGVGLVGLLAMRRRRS